MMFCMWWPRSEVPQEPVLHPPEQGLHRPRLLRRPHAARTRDAGLFEKAHHRRRARIGDHVVERPAVGRNALANRLQEDVFAQFDHARSEEHTSELQSLTNLVCRLLLENETCCKLT